MSGSKSSTPNRASEVLAGRYRLIERIGNGGSSEVWRARDERLDRDVAVKLLHPHLLPDTVSRDRFIAEARAAGALAHPSIVPVYDVIEDDDRAAIVFQLIPGETLAARIEATGPVAPIEAAEIARQLSGGLAHAHGHGLVHRDVKPANVLLTSDGRALLVDFGIAHMLEDARSTMTATGEVMGTLRYLSPEQLGGGRIDGRSDLFALGLVLHEILSGRPAFPAPSPIALVAAHAAGPPPLPATIPDELRGLTLQLLELDPARRPASAEAVEAELLRIERRESARRGPPAVAAPVAAARPAAAGIAAAQAVTMPLPIPAVAGDRLLEDATDGLAPGKPGRRIGAALMAAGIGVVGVLALVLAGSGVLGDRGHDGAVTPALAAPAATQHATATPRVTPRPTARPVVKAPAAPRHRRGKGHGNGDGEGD